MKTNVYSTLELLLLIYCTAKNEGAKTVKAAPCSPSLIAVDAKGILTRPNWKGKVSLMWYLLPIDGISLVNLNP